MRVDCSNSLLQKGLLVTTLCLPNRDASRSRHTDDVISGLAGVLKEYVVMAVSRNTSRRRQ